MDGGPCNWKGPLFNFFRRDGIGCFETFLKQGVVKIMRKILIVDDTAFMRFVMKGIIEEIGEFEVVEAKNGMEAITAYQQHKPVLVTMDITMPEMDGITAVRNIKAVDPQARIIICSAMGQQAMVVDAIKAGARGFLVKPFDREAVIRSIVNMLQE